MTKLLKVLLFVLVVACVLLFGLAWLGKKSSRGTVGGDEHDGYGGGYGDDGYGYGGGYDDDDDYGDYDGGYGDDFHGDDFHGGRASARKRLPYLGVQHELHERAKKGEKRIFIRVAKGRYGPEADSPLKVGDEVIIGRSVLNQAPGAKHKPPRRFKTTVTKISKHKSLAGLLKAVGGHKNVFPGMTEDEGLKDLEKYIKPEDVKEHGLVAIEVKPPTPADIKAAIEHEKQVAAAKASQ